MLDSRLNHIVTLPLMVLAQGCGRLGIKADTVTWIGFVIGIMAVPLIAFHCYYWAAGAILLNRLADGLDGAIARQSQPSDRGAFLDISLDFLFYSSVPLGFALANPSENALAASVLIYSFVGTGCTFLAYAIMAERRKLSSTRYPNKGFYYLGGLTEATETVLCFLAMCLFPSIFYWLAYVFAFLCLLTIITRLTAGWYNFTDKS